MAPSTAPAHNEPLVWLKQATIYQGTTPVLMRVDFVVHPGEFVYLVGRTGSGKTTLLRALHGDLPLQEGEGYVIGFNLRKMTWWRLPRLRRQLGIIFQDFRLLMDRTVADNLTFVLRVTGWRNRRKIQHRVDEMLKLVDLHTKAHKMPYELSGGEQQRLAIARALLNEPPLILADEPTGNLDPQTGREIMELLWRLHRQFHCAIILATHNYQWLQTFPGRIVVATHGKLLEHASPTTNRSG